MTDTIVRTRGAYLEAIARLDVEHAEKYRRRDVTGDGIPETWCNRFCSDACHELGALLPYMLVDGQLIWLESYAAREAGWEECSPARAEACASMGFPTLAIWSNPKGHGHISMVCPSLGGQLGLHIAQAGSTNYANAPIASGFGHLQPRFFTHW